MSTRKTAYAVIAFIISAGVVVVGGLHYFAEHGQFAPKSLTNDATKSDQKGNQVFGPGVPTSKADEKK
jgi:hypothetical protein